MNADIMILSLAEIPLLDWSGPSFLMFYGLAYFIALAASRRRARNALRPYENQNAPAGLEPYETAYLSGGPNRVTQMGVSKLILCGAAVWKQKFSGAHLIPVDGAKPRGLQPVEQRMWNQLAAAGSNGLKVNLLGATLQPDYTALEMRLAIRGLRPAKGERSSAAFAAVWPLLILLAIGVVKMMVGISRDRPVLFLFFLLILTVITAVIVAGKVPRITGKGETVLKNLREEVPGKVPANAGYMDMAL